ncbi:DUF6415 family natural product biosynthesis protein [Streptomyces sp. 8N616]|uniref:DUF6415 family natural product biosynthesis protein n=1 Tax=Streptomyces sp. 8N616 TaxID=3457414 RepID=UPI003FD5796D
MSRARRGIAEDPGELDEQMAAFFAPGHVELLIPEVERAAGRLDKDSISRSRMLACVGEARGKLHAEPRPGLEWISRPRPKTRLRPRRAV